MPQADDGARLPGLLPGERSDAVSIAALYGRVQAVLGRVFSRGQPLWVRGEIQSISDRTGHCYMDLVDPESKGGRDAPVLKVNCWARTWTPLKAALDRQGIELEPGLVVTLQGRVEIYPPRGQLNFIATDLDVTALLGRLAARRAALLRTLETEGLLNRNKALPVVPVPLVVGLVASRDTEGYRDFAGRLQESGFAFRVVHAAVPVQGSSAPSRIAAAVSTLSELSCDLVVVVRGGGSKGDLSVFDAEPVARAIATARAPVWTGIGHTGAQSVADIVAHTAFVTPTECGNEVVARVAGWWDGIAAASRTIERCAPRVLADALRSDAEARTRVCTSARNQIDRHAERLRHRMSRLGVAAPRSTDLASSRIRELSSRLTRTALGRVSKEEDRILASRRLLAAYDVERQLERGYTLTLGEDGRIVRSTAELTPCARLSTRFRDGRAESEVTAVTGNGEARR
jgi:exodeoxyribonuclease VII large subunit